MLNVFRENLRHLKWILWLVAGTFVVFFGTQWYLVDAGPGADWAVTVNGEPVSRTELLSTVQQLEQQYRQMLGNQYDRFAENLNLEQMALEQVALQEAITQDARRLGLTVPDDELVAQIRSTFVNQQGQFMGTNELERRVRAGQFGPINSLDQLYRLLREQMLIGKWYDLLRSTIVVDPAAVEEEFRRRNEKVTFRYIALPTEALADEIEIADADLQAWYEAHRDRYTGGEGRRAIYVLIDEDAVAERVDISDEEVESYYEESRQVFERPERRELRQILLSVAPDASPDQVEAARQRAAELAARARGGEEFAALATQASDDEASRERGGQIGTFTRTQMEPAMAERVFALEEGAVSDPIRSDTGFHVVKVEDVLEAGVQPLEEVADQIRGQLRFRQSRDIGAEVAEELRERAAETGNLRAAAEEMELDPRDTGVVTRSGTVPGLGPVPQMIETMFELEPGEVSEVLSLPRGEAVLVVQETVPRYLPPLDTQRQQVEADFRRDRAGEQASERIEQALERAGGDLEAAARRLGAEVRETEPPFLRNQPLPEVGTSIALERAAFTTPVGEMVGPVRTDEAVVALEVVERQEPDPEQLEAERAQLLEALRQPRFQRLLQEKTQQLLERAEIDYNPEVQPAPAEG